MKKSVSTVSTCMPGVFIVVLLFVLMDVLFQNT